jgi:hypothetical protein
MKRVLLMLAATAAFACTGAMAQAGGGAGGGTAGGGTAGSGSPSGSAAMGAQGNVSPGGQEGSTTQTNTGHHHKKNGAMNNESGKSGKKSTLTGCISASPNSDGMYTLSNGRYKNGVEIGPSDKVKDHAGHQVALKGTWSTAAAAGENAGVASSTGTSEKGEKHFDVSSVKHISDTCKEAPGGGTMGHKAHNKKNKSGSTGDNGATSSTPPPSR